MTFTCPQCLRSAEIEPHGPGYEIVTVYCLHRVDRLDGGSSLVRMMPAPTPATPTPEAAAAGT